jgi:hypothetical protein
MSLLSDHNEPQLARTKWEQVDRSNGHAGGAGDIQISTWRLPVPGGWLYKITEQNFGHLNDEPDRYDIKVVFVPHAVR